MNSHPSHSPYRSVLLVLAAFVLLAAACSGSDGEPTGVATLEGVAGADEPGGEETPTDGPDSIDATLAADEAALEFSQCMRDQGLDFPDIGVNTEGNPDIGEAFQNSDVQPRSEEFRDAIQECGDILQGAGFGGGRGRLADNTEIQDAFVEFSECIRDEGFDVGDLQFGGPGGGNGPGAGDGPPDGDRPQRGQGRGQGGFGDRSNRIAEALGLDPQDPGVEAALAECSPILDTAFSQFGPGASNNE